MASDFALLVLDVCVWSLGAGDRLVAEDEDGGLAAEVSVEVFQGTGGGFGLGAVRWGRGWKDSGG